MASLGMTYDPCLDQMRYAYEEAKRDMGAASRYMLGNAAGQIMSVTEQRIRQEAFMNQAAQDPNYGFGRPQEPRPNPVLLLL